MIASPCTKVCLLDPASGLCRGCGRSGVEIAAWPYLSSEARLALVALLPARMAARERD